MKVIGYVMFRDRYDRKYYFEGTMSNLAKFIMYYGEKADSITITDQSDRFILSTIGNFLDRVADDKLLNDLLKELVPLQFGKNYKPLEFKEVEPGVLKYE